MPAVPRFLKISENLSMQFKKKLILRRKLLKKRKIFLTIFRLFLPVIRNVEHGSELNVKIPKDCKTF